MIYGKHQIEICRIDDKEELILFIQRHWNPKHIFIHSQQLLDWQHQDRPRGRYNFIVGRASQVGELGGILGFIPTAQFDPLLSERRETWLTMWKVVCDPSTVGLGRRLMEFVFDHLQPNFLCAVGISDRVESLYRRMGFQTGLLRRHYLVNPYKSNFLLVKGNEARPTSHRNTSAKALVPIDPYLLTGEEPYLTASFVPTKSRDFLIARYLRHPVYQYDIFGVKNENRIEALLVMRLCTCKGAHAYRVVDFVGEEHALSGLHEAFLNLLQLVEAEYIDFYHYGIDEDVLKDSGLRPLLPSSSLIVPNYFEPFLQENISLRYAFRSQSPNRVRIFKGDGDQDRPSLPQ